MSLELYTAAHPDHYAPLPACAEGRPRLRPRAAAVPADWAAAEAGLWTVWTPPGARYGDSSLRVGSAARIGREQHVLDAFAAVCFAHGVPFRHVATLAVHAVLNGGRGSRPQAGRFCVAAPADAGQARELLHALHRELRGETGPVPLSGRRHEDSGVLWSDERPDPARDALRPDGVRAALGEDELLEGPAPAPAAPEGYAPTRLLDAASTGYAFLARDTRSGRDVLVEQRFAHAAVDADGRSAADRLGERHRALLRIHAEAPGLCPRPLHHAADGHCAWLVTEAPAGVPLTAWVVAHSPLPDSKATSDAWSAYHRRAAALITRAEQVLARLQESGAALDRVDVADILIGPDDTVSLTSTTAALPGGEPAATKPQPAAAPRAAQPATTARTGTTPEGPGSGALPAATGTAPAGGAPQGPGADTRIAGCPAPDRMSADLLAAALGSLALHVLTPAASAAALDAGVLPHVRRDLERRGAPVPDGLWRVAARGAGPAGGVPLPGPDDVEGDERAALAALRDRLAAGVLGAAEDVPWHMFPTVPQGYRSNTLGVAYGAAGVVHALRVSGAHVPDWVAARLRRDALAQADRLAPGLYSGLAGIAWVLADLGHPGEASELLAAADRHPLTRASATLAWGGAGVAMAHLAVFGHTGERHHLDRAAAFADRLPEAPAALGALLGPNDMTGLWYGRTGVAQALQQLAAVTGEHAWLRRARALLHAELDRAAEQRGELTFPVSARDRRQQYYLYCGTAGFLTAAARQSAALPDERLAAAVPKLVRKASMTQVAHAGLGNGLAGLGFALAECGRILGDPTARAAAWRSARALFLHAVPLGASARVLGDLRLRFSCELWSGGAGVLLFLAALLDERPDPLFTVDALAAGARGAVPAQTSRSSTDRAGSPEKDHPRKGNDHVEGPVAAVHGDR